MNQNNFTNYTHSSLKYVFHNLWYIVLLSIIPGACLSGMAVVEDTQKLFTAFFTGHLQDVTWGQLFHTLSIFNFTGWLPALLSLISFFAIVFCAAMLLALIDKHMRIGKRTLNGVVGKLNDNIISTLFIATLFATIYELWVLIFSSLAYGIFQVIPLLPLQYVLFGVLFVVGGVALLYVVALFYLWLPCMQITGFRAFEALRYSNQLTEKVKRRLILSMIISLFVGNAFIIPTAIFLHTYMLYIVMLLVYMFYFMLFVVRMEVVYFDVAGLEREDLKKRYDRD